MEIFQSIFFIFRRNWNWEIIIFWHFFWGRGIFLGGGVTFFWNFQIEYQKSLLVFNSYMKKTLKLWFGRRPQHRFNFSQYVFVRLIQTCIQKISLLDCLFLQIAMKKIITLRFGRRPQVNSNFFSIFILFKIISSYIPEISLLACLILAIAVKKTLKLGFGRRPQI